MSDRIPAETFPPGDLIQEELEERGWSEAELAAMMGCSELVVRELVTAERRVNAALAQALGAAFGTGAEFWVNLEASYRRERRPADGGAAPRRVRLPGLTPAKEMVKGH
jgi:HTH-type transcriptional regulator/antitoxin HigA